MYEMYQFLILITTFKTAHSLINISILISNFQDTEVILVFLALVLKIENAHIESMSKNHAIKMHLNNKNEKQHQ